MPSARIWRCARQKIAGAAVKRTLPSRVLQKGVTTYAEKLLFWTTRFVETRSRLLSDSKLFPTVREEDMSTSSGKDDGCKVCDHMNNEHNYHKCTIYQKRDAWRICQAAGAHPNTQRTSTYDKCKVCYNGGGPFPNLIHEMIRCCKLRIRSWPKPNNLMPILGSFFASLGPDTLTSNSLGVLHSEA